MKKLCNCVLEGGGVKGIGHVGAIAQLEQDGYVIDQVAGSSAGAIVAALLAVGYSGEEMYTLMKDIDYLKFQEEDFLDKIGTVGKFFSIVLDYGIYSANYLESWLDKLLSNKKKHVFGDVKNPDGTYRLHVTTCDISKHELLVFPDDLDKFHIDKDSFSIASAVRMSMSIPIYYEPYKLKDIHGHVHYMVDGGLLSNYPMWILDDGISVPKQPIFGFKFIRGDIKKTCCYKQQSCTNVIDYGKQIISTLLDATDNHYRENSSGDNARSIFIPSMIAIDGNYELISTTDFDITKEESDALYENGREAARAFLESFNFESWIRTYRDPLYRNNSLQMYTPNRKKIDISYDYTNKINKLY